MKFKKRLKLPEEYDVSGKGHKIWPQSTYDQVMHDILLRIKDLNRFEKGWREHRDEPLGDEFMDDLYNYAETADWIARHTMSLRYYLCDFCGYDEVEEE